MTQAERKTIELPEICRVEGHSAVTVDIYDGQVKDVKLEVFEGTRFFEKIVVGHKCDQMPHITSRVCAICSTGHVLASIFAVENIIGFRPDLSCSLLRELMHLGMIIESHATHVCALALPDFLGTPDLHDFATKHAGEFAIWTKLRNLGSKIQTVLGGRPFHPINLHVGGFSHYPGKDELRTLLSALDEHRELAINLANLVLDLELPFEGTAAPSFLALVPEGSKYSYFGSKVKSSDNWEAPVSEYQSYLQETVVDYSHAKRSLARGKVVMVGALARLHLFADKLSKSALKIYSSSPLASGKRHTVLNNLAQAIEIVDAIDRSVEIIEELLADEKTAFGTHNSSLPDLKKILKAGSGTGAVECPRGTLYHFYQIDSEGTVEKADLLTPSAQNTARIEEDIRSVVQHHYDSGKSNPAAKEEPQTQAETPDLLNSNLETLIRSYDPCNTCATHMLQIKYLD